MAPKIDTELLYSFILIANSDETDSEAASPAFLKWVRMSCCGGGFMIMRSPFDVRVLRVTCNARQFTSYIYVTFQLKSVCVRAIDS